MKYKRKDLETIKKIAISNLASGFVDGGIHYWQKEAVNHIEDCFSEKNQIYAIFKHLKKKLFTQEFRILDTFCRNKKMMIDFEK